MGNLALAHNASANITTNAQLDAALDTHREIVAKVARNIETTLRALTTVSPDPANRTFHLKMLEDRPYSHYKTGEMVPVTRFFIGQIYDIAYGTPQEVAWMREPYGYHPTLRLPGGSQHHREHVRRAVIRVENSTRDALVIANKDGKRYSRGDVYSDEPQGWADFMFSNKGINLSTNRGSGRYESTYPQTEASVLKNLHVWISRVAPHKAEEARARIQAATYVEPIPHTTDKFGHPCYDLQNK